MEHYTLKKVWRYVKPFRYNTGMWRTDGRTKLDCCADA